MVMQKVDVMVLPNKGFAYVRRKRKLRMLLDQILEEQNLIA